MVRKTAKVGFSALFLLLVGIAGVTGWANRDSWMEFIKPAPAAPHDEHAHAHKDRVAISPQAQASLALDSKPIALATEPYWQTISVPGTIVERPGACEFTVSAPLIGVVAEILVTPGEVVQPGKTIFKIRVTSDSVLSSQTALFGAVQDLKIADDQYQRLMGLQGTVPQTKLFEIEYEQRRLRAKEKSIRFELETHGFSKEQVAAVAAGEFLTHIEVRAPAPAHAVGIGHSHDVPFSFEVEELKVGAGDHVEQGAPLCVLAEHRTLFVEGRLYRNEIPLVQRAAENNWRVQLEFPEAEIENTMWSSVPRIGAAALGTLAASFGQGALASAVTLFPGNDKQDQELAILSVGNRADADSQTAPVFLRLPNEFREYEKNGRSYRNWRYRPAQRVFLRVPVKRFDNVFVLPAGAVVQDGVETFVFRQNGDAFERKPVHVLFQDQRNVVIAHDGSISIGNYIAHNGAAHLLRALKMQSAEGGGGHEHHNHEH